MAIGMFVVPLLIELIRSGNEGATYPIPTPNAMAIKIHRVRFLSKKLNFLFVAIAFTYI
jgi:hypothetical protein